MRSDPSKSHLFVLFITNNDIPLIPFPSILLKLSTIADEVSMPQSNGLVTDTENLAHLHSCSCLQQPKSLDIVVVQHHGRHLSVISVKTKNPVIKNSLDLIMKRIGRHLGIFLTVLRLMSVKF